MNVILPIFASVLLVTAQASWKKAFSSVTMKLSTSFFLSKEFLGLLFSPFFLFGAFLYVIATVFYLYLFNRYNFYSVQSIMLVSSITLSFLIASFIFHETVTVYKVLGLVLLIAGVFLIFKR